jgi:hypothetical protein
MHAASAGAGSAAGGSADDGDMPAPLTGKLQEPIRRLEEVSRWNCMLHGQQHEQKCAACQHDDV